ncbi:ComEA family DNA-binding protein [Ureibacillus manganicus]|nr:helix-hairpin-helix domain-containing protein [Ureibacillus manganicus]
MVIYIPKTGDSLNDEQTDTFITVPTTFTASNLININLANESDLLTLPGIGPSKAQAIITYRDENGRFQSIEDLKKVSGIGDKTFEKLKEFITIKQ